MPPSSSLSRSAAAARRAASASYLARLSPRSARRGRSSSPPCNLGRSGSAPNFWETFCLLKRSVRRDDPPSAPRATSTMSATSSAKSSSMDLPLSPILRCACTLLASSLLSGTRVMSSSSTAARASSFCRCFTAAMLSKPGSSALSSSGAPATSWASSCTRELRAALRRMSSRRLRSSRLRAGLSMSFSMLTGLSLGGRYTPGLPPSSAPPAALAALPPAAAAAPGTLATSWSGCGP
mmetsp:Transcript_9019/g.19399  ORF Transcript_9019/g.19399 Transcript_9019/m.19399 type:complete len:237 (-) Transcript_9019:539-1249(-)